MQAFRQKRQINARLSKWVDGVPQRNMTEAESEQNQDALSPSPTSWDAFDEDLNPKNWPFWKRFSATLLVTAISVVVQYASAVDSAAAQVIQDEFGVSAVTESLATGLFLIGFGIGAPVAGPLSEIAGRNPVYIITFVLFMCFSIGAALSPNIGAQLAFRFLAGACGSTPLVCAGGTMSDLWNHWEQIYIFPIYAAGAFIGLSVGPAIGGVIVESKLVGWRWVDWSTVVFSGAVLLLVLLFQPETFGPVLLRWKAESLAKHMKLKPEAFTSQQQSGGALRRVTTRDLGNKIAGAFYRPVEFAIHEPIVVLISLYLSVLYIISFTFLPGYTFVFTDTYGFGPRLRGLSFLGLGVGFLLALTLTPLVALYSKRIIERDGELYPEARLLYAMCGAPTIPVSLFWMAWTTRESISPWSPIAASTLFGFGLLCIFISSYQYIIHTYGQYAASGLVFVTLTRYLVAGGMIVVGIPMYSNLGVAWTLTLLALLAALLVPIPFCFFFFGARIRKWSKHSA